MCDDSHSLGILQVHVKQYRVDHSVHTEVLGYPVTNYHAPGECAQFDGEQLWNFSLALSFPLSPIRFVLGLFCQKWNWPNHEG
jgi:hypothetical protein